MTLSIKSLLAAVFALGLASAAAAQDTALESLDTWGQSRGWEGVGLLIIAQRASCTGVLIEPSIVLTAAHCLYDPATGERADPRKIEFRAGWRNGKSVAQRFGKAAVIHASYVNKARASGDQIRNDLALLQLSAPIQSTHANPFRTDGGVGTGHAVSVVSYGSGRNDAPSRQRSCEVLDTRRGLVVMSCDVVPGSSGAPIFAMRNGQPRIVSLVSALGHIDKDPVSFGMDIQRPFSEVMADFRSGRGVYPAKSVAAKRITVGQANSSGSAKFLRP